MDRFWSKVRKTSECWLWEGSTDSCGYGTFWLEGRVVGAHRVSWILKFGSVPSSQSVLHKCDVRRCVNPAHLFLGTQTDNMKDAASKGRLLGRTTATGDAHGSKTCPESVLRGERNGNASLTEAQVSEIRNSYPGCTQKRLATRYGVSQRTISRIVRGETYSCKE